MKPNHWKTIGIVAVFVVLAMGLARPVAAQNQNTTIVTDEQQIEPAAHSFELTVTTPSDLRVEGRYLLANDCEWLTELISSQAMPQALRRMDNHADTIRSTITSENHWRVYVLTWMSTEVNGVFDIQFRVDLPESALSDTTEVIDPEAIAELSRHTATQLQSILNSAFRERFDAAEQATQVLRRRAEDNLIRYRDESNQLMRAFQDVLREAGVGYTEISRQGVMAAMGRREEQRQQSRLQQNALDVRRMAIENRILETSRRIDDVLSNDPVSEQLTEIMIIQQRKADQTRRLVETGYTNEAALIEANTEAMQTRTRLLLRQEELQRNNGGDRLVALNDELGAISVAITENSAALQRLNHNQIDASFMEAMALADQYEMVAVELEVAKDVYRASLHATFENERQAMIEMLGEQAPKVRVSN